MKMKKIFLLVLLISISCIISGCYYEVKPVVTEIPPSTEKVSEPATAEIPSEEEQPPSKENNLIPNTELKFKVIEAKTYAFIGNEYFNTKPKGIFYVVVLEIENVGKEAYTFIADDFKLVDELNRTFDPSTSAMMYLSDGLSFWDEINPGLKATAKILFDVPKEEGHTYKLLAYGSWLNIIK